MEERRRARVGSVCGLTLLVAGTAVAAVAGGSHSAFSSVALGLLALALGHSLLDEIRRQAGRRSSPHWTAHDTVNTVVLAAAAVAGLGTTLFGGTPVILRAVVGPLSLGYALSAVYFVALRRRTVQVGAPAPTNAVVVTDGPS